MSVERKELAKRASALHDVALGLQGAFEDLHDDLKDEGDRALVRSSRDLDNAGKVIEQLRVGLEELARAMRGLTLDEAIQSLIDARDKVGGNALLLMADRLPVRSFGAAKDGGSVFVYDVV